MGNTYLTFFADAAGESTAKGHKGWIDVIGWNWEVDLASGPAGGSGGSVAKAVPSALHVTHHFDKASVPLMRSLVTGRHIPKAQLEVVEQGVVTIRIVLEGVVPTRLAAAATSTPVVQELALSFESIRIEYRSKAPKATPEVITWDVVRNTTT